MGPPWWTKPTLNSLHPFNQCTRIKRQPCMFQYSEEFDLSLASFLFQQAAVVRHNTLEAFT